MLFNLDFTNNAILSCFFLFFIIIDLCFLISAVIAKIFNPIAELITPIETPVKEAKAEMETDSVNVETKIREFSIQFTAVKTFYSSTHFALFLQENNFLLRLYFLD